MIFGRDTQQWLGLISAALALAEVLIIVAVPNVDAAQVAIILSSIGTFLGVLIAFIAREHTTPVLDARIPEGTEFSTTDPKTGEVTGTKTA
jgi:hypothetical protein